MNLGARLYKLEANDCSKLRIAILYEGDLPPEPCNGLTVTIRKPGHRL